jgi:hypothetical protein
MWFYIVIVVVIVVGVVLLIALTVWRCGKPAAGQHPTVLQQIGLGSGQVLAVGVESKALADERRRYELAFRKP